jgi:acyl-CoA hydrolase/ribosomal protein S18 acetylase RimI-like enzyme
MRWKQQLVSPDQVIHLMRPGMRVFVSTGAAEPRTLVQHLMASGSSKLQDLELIQLASFAEAVALNNLQAQKFRLKTFFSGWVAQEAIAAGRVDLIPSRLSQISRLMATGNITVDAAFVQITPPDKAGYCSLGVAVDVARVAMEQARLRVGEINPQVPRTLGDTVVHVTDFTWLVAGRLPPIYFSRWPPEPVFEKIAENAAGLIEDRSCLAFSIGPLYDALGRALAGRQDLGIHSPAFSDALMDLVKKGVVTNRYKAFFRGKCLTSYAYGTAELFQWLDQNPAVEFQPVDKVYDPIQIGRNPRFVAIIPARKVDLTGRIQLITGKGYVSSGSAEVMEFFMGAQLSRGGFTIFGLPSRSRDGRANIVASIKGYRNRMDFREAVDHVVSEFGVASLKGLTLRERVQALVEIAHPEDRAELVAQAKQAKLLYPDQIFIDASTWRYPGHIAETRTFKNNVTVRFRPIKPSDEEQMRRLFYRFSDKAVYYRYFSPVEAMPHAKMQTYVNVDWSKDMSIVGLVGGPGQERIIAEGRYLADARSEWAEVAFVVDEDYQCLGICTYLLQLLVGQARERGLKGFYADVLASNTGMIKVFKRSGLKVNAERDQKYYSVAMGFNEFQAQQASPQIKTELVH